MEVCLNMSCNWSKNSCGFGRAFSLPVSRLHGSLWELFSKQKWPEAKFLFVRESVYVGLVFWCAKWFVYMYSSNLANKRLGAKYQGSVRHFRGGGCLISWGCGIQTKTSRSALPPKTDSCGELHCDEQKQKTPCILNRSNNEPNSQTVFYLFKTRIFEKPAQF